MAEETPGGHGTPRGPTDGPAPRPASALLELVGSEALDPAYARARAERPASSTPGRRVALLAVLGLMLAVAVVQTAAGAAGVREGRQELTGQIERSRAVLAQRRTRLSAAERELARLRGVSLDASRVAGAAASRRAGLQAAAGDLADAGEGLRVVVDDAPGATDDQHRVLDRDLQRLVNALWQSGATAIAIDGVRLTALTAIRTAGQSITVGYRSLRGPYVVVALGDPSAMQTAFVDTTHGRYWYDLAATVGLRFSIQPRDRLVVPAARPATLRYARTRVGPASPSPNRQESP